MLLPPEDQQKINEEAQKLVNQSKCLCQRTPLHPRLCKLHRHTYSKLSKLEEIAFQVTEIHYHIRKDNLKALYRLRHDLSEDFKTYASMFPYLQTFNTACAHLYRLWSKLPYNSGTGTHAGTGTFGSGRGFTR